MIFRLKQRWWSSIAVALVAWLIAWRAGGLEHLSGRFDSVWIALGVGVAAGVGLMLANFAVDRALRWWFGVGYEQAFERFALDVIGTMTPVDAIAGGVLAGVGEEPLFRGLLLPALGHPVAGVIGAAVLFGLAHYLRREYFGFFVWGIGEGVVFGTLFVLTGSILVPAVAHGLFDAVGFLYFVRLRVLHRARGEHLATVRV